MSTALLVSFIALVAGVASAAVTAFFARRTGKESNQISLIDKAQSSMEASLDRALVELDSAFRRIERLEGENLRCLDDRRALTEELRQLRLELAIARKGPA